MKKLFASFALAAVVATPATQAVAADTYAIDAFHTFPSFEVNHLGFSTQRGRFDKTSGTVVIDAAAKKGSIDLTIEVASLNMGFAVWNEHMAAEGFFNTAKYPTITFKSNKLVFEGDKVVGAEGDFTLLGVTKPVKLAVSNFKCGENPFNKKAMCGADISTTIKRSEFGMTKGLPAIGDEIKIMSAVEAFKQ